MSDKSKPLMVRLPHEHAKEFERLSLEFAGLPPATVLRMMAISFLQQSFDTQVQRIEEQIRPARKTTPKPFKNNNRSTVIP
jgi:hypothetical protein